jgi:hypothetical protein
MCLAYPHRLFLIAFIFSSAQALAFDLRKETALNLDGKVDRVTNRDVKNRRHQIRTDRNFDGKWDMITDSEITDKPTG